MNEWCKALPNPNLYTRIYTRTLACTQMHSHTLARIYRHKFLGKNMHKLCEKTHEINQQWLPIISSPAGGNRQSPKCWMSSLNCNM